jgi:hypothetical protein
MSFQHAGPPGRPPADPGRACRPPDAWSVARVSRALVPGPRALARAALVPEPRALVRARWAALVRALASVCIYMQTEPPGRVGRAAGPSWPSRRAELAGPPGRAGRAGRAELAELAGPGPPWCPVPGARAAAAGPRARCQDQAPGPRGPEKRALAQAAPALARFHTLGFT